MILVKPSFDIKTFSPSVLMNNIERAGRVCYKSEDKITSDSASGFVQIIIKRGHEAMIEHESITIQIICDRGVSHEIVRHRI